MQTGKERDCLEGEDGGAIALALCPFPRILRPRQKELTHNLLLFPVTLHHFFGRPLRTADFFAAEKRLPPLTIICLQFPSWITSPFPYLSMLSPPRKDLR